MQARNRRDIHITRTTTPSFGKEHKRQLIAQGHFNNTIRLDVIALALCTCQYSGVIRHHGASRTLRTD